MKTSCEIIYHASNHMIQYGEEQGICRITGKESTGILFDSWVRDTFTDHAFLKPGTIISNEALFCFDEASTIIQHKTGRDKPQRFRTYSHFVIDGEWICMTKADKAQMFDILVRQDPQVAVISESGQKHLVFKHVIGTWQFEDLTIQRDTEGLLFLHSAMMHLSNAGFSVGEIGSGQYAQHRIMKAGIAVWQNLENHIKPHRGSALFDLALFFAKVQ